MSLPLPHEELLRTIGAVADRKDIEVFLVGGAVRDALLERPTTDLDFVTIGQDSGIRLAKAVAKDLGGAAVSVYENFGTAGIRLPAENVKGEDEDEEDFVLEFVAARKESYQRDSRKPDVEAGSLDEDQARRDFTINALAVALNKDRFGNLLDPFGGMIDLLGKRLRTPLDPRRTFDDDPLRMMRAARFAAQLGFEIDIETRRSLREQSPRLTIVSQERITDELNKILQAERPSVGLRILFEAELLPHFLPELSDLAGVETVGGQSHKDNFFHTIEVVDHAADATSDWDPEDALWLRWAALLHDIGKPSTKRFSKTDGWTFHGHEDVGARMIPDVFRRLKLPLDDRMKYVELLVRLHHRPVSLVDDEVTDSAVRRLLVEAGDAIDDLMILVRADITSKNPARVRRYLNAFDRVEEKFAEVEERDQLRNFQPPIDGHEIMQRLGVGEGIAVGIMKEWIREAILEGDLANDYEEARVYLGDHHQEALRRGHLFDEVVKTMSREERASLGRIKEEVFWHELPEEEAEALAHLRGLLVEKVQDPVR